MASLIRAAILSLRQLSVRAGPPVRPRKPDVVGRCRSSFFNTLPSWKLPANENDFSLDAYLEIFPRICCSRVSREDQVHGA